MAMTLNVDGVRTEGPSDTDIAHGFESLDKEEARIFSGPGLSIITLDRSDTESLTATGTYAQGFILGYQNGRPEDEVSTDLHDPVPVEKVIKAFQSYARGEDWGQSKFEWKRVGIFDGNPQARNRRLTLAIVIFVVLAIVIMKLLTTR